MCYHYGVSILNMPCEEPRFDKQQAKQRVLRDPQC